LRNVGKFTSMKASTVLWIESLKKKQ